MRYVTAFVGAVIVFAGCGVVCLVLTAFPAFQGEMTLNLGVARFTIRNPIALAGIPIGLLAAYHSFRSTLSRYNVKDETEDRG
jgi:hypothetical protein